MERTGWWRVMEIQESQDRWNWSGLWYLQYSTRRPDGKQPTQPQSTPDHSSLTCWLLLPSRPIPLPKVHSPFMVPILNSWSIKSFDLESMRVNIGKKLALLSPLNQSLIVRFVSTISVEPMPTYDLPNSSVWLSSYFNFNLKRRSSWNI